MLPKNILLGYDGSPGADQALDLAASLAKATGAALVIHHVLYIGAEAYASGVLDVAALESQLDKMLDGAVERARAQGVDASKVLSRGDVASMILREVERRGVDLIVVGSLGRGRMARMLTGSVADKLVRGAPVPVLVVR